MHLRRILSQAALVIGALIFSIGLQAFAASFQQPTGTAPTGDAYAPLDTGVNPNTKVGPLVVNTGGSQTGLIVPSGNVGIDTGTTNPPIRGLEIGGASGEMLLGRQSPSNIAFFNVSDDNGNYGDQSALYIRGLVNNGNAGSNLSTVSINANTTSMTGAVHATGDICTDAGGGKCLSTVGGGSSSTVITGTCPTGQHMVGVNNSTETVLCGPDTVVSSSDTQASYCSTTWSISCPSGYYAMPASVFYGNGTSHQLNSSSITLCDGVNSNTGGTIWASRGTTATLIGFCVKYP